MQVALCGCAARNTSGPNLNLQLLLTGTLVGQMICLEHILAHRRMCAVQLQREQDVTPDAPFNASTGAVGAGQAPPQVALMLQGLPRGMPGQFLVPFPASGPPQLPVKC